MRSVQRHIIGWLLLIGVLIAGSGLQMIWFQQSYQTQAAASGGTYAEGVIGPIDTLNPLYAVTSAEASLSRLLYSTLYTYDTSGNLHSDLATDIAISQDDTVYTVTMRDDARWSDGRPVTARDVAFTINLIKDPRAQSPLRISWQSVNVETLNDTTVIFTLPAAYASFRYALTFPILPAHKLSDVSPEAVRENKFSQLPVTSGPFRFSSQQVIGSDNDKKVVVMSANQQYYIGQPKLSKFEIHSYPTEQSVVQALQTNEINAAEIDTSSLSKLPKNYTATQKSVNNGVYALFNNSNEILKDQSVRKALRLAIDTKEVRRSLSGTHTIESLDLPFLNGQLTGESVPKAPVPDKRQAEKLLDDAGWKMVGSARQKAGKTLMISITTTKDDQYEKALDSVKKQWQAIGIEVTSNIVNTTDPSVNFVKDTLQARNYDVLLYELSIGADPDVYAYWHSSQANLIGFNFSNYSNITADTSLASARSRLEPELRNIKYIAFANQWLDDVPAIGLYQSSITYVSNRSIRAITNNMKLITATDRYANVLDWTVKRGYVYKTP